MMEEKIVIQNKRFSLTLNPDATCDSLVYKPLAEECLYKAERVPFFTITEQRPFNNEIKLAYPNKQTTYNANRVRRDGNKLIVGFELIHLEAEVEIVENDEYISFKLNRIIIPDNAFGIGVIPMKNVVYVFRLIQLPVLERSYFGQWLNVVWDDKVAVNVLASSPYAIIDCEQKNGYKMLSCDLHRDLQLENTGACIITCGSNELLECIDILEQDFDLPRGVQSRKNKETYASIYCTDDICPKNVDEHIKYALKGGFRVMKIYFPAIFLGTDDYKYCSEYVYNDNYPNGEEDLKLVLSKLKKAGIHPGIHVLHTHIGLKTKYVTPRADSRLNLTKILTLSNELSEDDTVIYVEQNPASGIRHEKCNLVRFGTEIIRFESISEEYPYCLMGCERGYCDTYITPHPRGEMGGILDVTEFTATSIYVDQDTSLQDEIADKIADVYANGFEFIYFDGSEGTNPPFEVNVPLAQYRVYKKLGVEPLYCEGAAKAHFSWHMLSGGNAFDIFPTNIFKKMLVEHPFTEAELMKMDFTRVNTGWWKFYEDTQPDTFEFGISKSAALDCPGSVMLDFESLYKNPRTDDIFEVMRRWEDMRFNNLITPEMKGLLKNYNQEYTILINEKKEYELVPYYEMTEVTNVDNGIRAFYFERLDKSYVVYWNTKGDGMLELKLDSEKFSVKEELYLDDISIASENGVSKLPASGKKYIISELPREELTTAICNGKVVM